MNIFGLPIFGFNGKNYAFNRYLEGHLASRKAITDSKLWTFDETNKEIINSWRN